MLLIQNVEKERRNLKPAKLPHLLSVLSITFQYTKNIPFLP